MSDTEFEIPDPVINAIEDGTPAVKAFRQSSGLSQHDVAADAGIVANQPAQTVGIALEKPDAGIVAIGSNYNADCQVGHASDFVCRSSL